ncbi:Type 1 glutamine amidotransferase-like domain-containing protein [Aliarcobacter butzleri]
MILTKRKTNKKTVFSFIIQRCCKYFCINNKLRNNDFIYITGGNTFFLLQELKKTGADKIIIDEINKGKLYIGESAGAIVTSANVEYAKRMDDVKKAPNLTKFSGLNLVDFYVIPHYTNFPFEKTVEKIIEDYSSKLNLSPISNKDAILVVDNKIDFIQSQEEK